MSEVKEKIIKQATKLASTIANSLSSGGDDAMTECRVTELAREAIYDHDWSTVISAEELVTEGNVKDIAKECAEEAVCECDWNQVISDHDVVTSDSLGDRMDEKIEEVFDAKLFGLLQEFILNQFKPDVEAWMDEIRRQGVNKYVEEQKEKEDNDE